MLKKMVEIILHLQVIQHNLGGYSHREHCRAPDRIMAQISSINICRVRGFFEIILHCKAIKHNLGGYSHRERCRAPDRITAKCQSTNVSTQFIYKIILETFPSCARRKHLGCCTPSAKVRPAELSSWAKDRSSNVNT